MPLSLNGAHTSGNAIPGRLGQFKMSKLKIKNARMPAASGNLPILNFAFLILLLFFSLP